MGKQTVVPRRDPVPGDRVETHGKDDVKHRWPSAEQRNSGCDDPYDRAKENEQGDGEMQACQRRVRRADGIGVGLFGGSLEERCGGRHMTAINGGTRSTSRESTSLCGMPGDRWASRGSFPTSRCAKFIWTDVRHPRRQGLMSKPCAVEGSPTLASLGRPWESGRCKEGQPHASQLAHRAEINLQAARRARRARMAIA